MPLPSADNSNPATANPLDYTQNPYPARDNAIYRLTTPIDPAALSRFSDGAAKMAGLDSTKSTPGFPNVPWPALNMPDAGANQWDSFGARRINMDARDGVNANYMIPPQQVAGDSGNTGQQSQISMPKTPDYMVQSGGSAPTVNSASPTNSSAISSNPPGTGDNNGAQPASVTQNGDGGGTLHLANGITMAAPQSGQGTDESKTGNLGITIPGLGSQAKSSTASPGSPADIYSTPGANTGSVITSGGMSPRIAQPQPQPATANSNQAWKSMVPSVQKQNEQRDAAQLSAASYEDDGGVQKHLVPSNYDVVSGDEMKKMGLDPAKFSDPYSGFYASLYRNKETGKYVLAFRGTEKTSWKDWLTDVEQGMGFGAKQYQQAIDLGRAVDASTRKMGTYVSFAGHSLGGGLAAAAALATKRAANTFNAASVNSRTLSRYGVETSPDADKILINSFYIPGEALSDVQGLSAAGLGNDIRLHTMGLVSPVGTAQGRRIPIDTKTPWYDPVDKHAIDEFTGSMK